MQIKTFLEDFGMFLTCYEPILKTGILNMDPRKVPQLLCPHTHLYGNSETTTPLKSSMD